MKTIITHPGMAHRDDFLSCALAIYLHPEIDLILRREPSQDEVHNVDILVLDVGQKADKSMMTFDHHQLPRNADPACALSLFSEAEGIDTILDNFDWYEFTVVLDSKGPFATAKAFGWEEFPFVALSPIENAMLALFQEETTVSSDSVLFKIMKRIGENILVTARKFQEKLDLAKKTTTTIVRNGVVGLMNMEPSEKKISSVMGKIRNDFFPEAGFSISLDDRGSGLTLYRFSDDPRVDFSKLEGHPMISFAHKGGFIAKTTEVPTTAGLTELLELAITSGI